MEPETQHVWITTRRLKPGTREVPQAWRPAQFPRMLSAHEYWAEDRGRGRRHLRVGVAAGAHEYRL